MTDPEVVNELYYEFGPPTFAIEHCIMCLKEALKQLEEIQEKYGVIKDTMEK